MTGQAWAPAYQERAYQEPVYQERAYQEPAYHATGHPRVVRGHRAPGDGGALRRNVVAEFRRTLSVRGWLYQLVCAVGVAALLTVAVVSTIDQPNGVSMATAQGVRTVFSGGYIAVLLATVLGIVSVTNEYRHRTIGGTLLAAVRPHRWLLGKLVVVAVLGTLFAVLGQAAVLAIGVPGLRDHGVRADVWADPLRQLSIGTVSLGPLCAMWGVGLGLLLRNQILAVTGVVVYSTLVESALLHYFPDQGRYLPGGLQTAILDDPNYHHVPTAAGYALFAGWIVLVLVAGWLRLARGDVPA